MSANPASHRKNRDAIAIIGMGCRFPGAATSLDAYWQLLCDGECAISEIPPDRWSLDGFHDLRPDIPTRSYSKWAGLLQDVRSFDPEFYGLTPREAEAMDPQQRILLDVVSETARHSRLTIAKLREAVTGVFVGASNIDYGLLQRDRPDRGEILAGTGTALSIVANRVSNTLSFSGPSMVVDTACSSALVALDTACHNLKSEACDYAFAGGANILLDPRMFVTFSRAHMLSPSGRIRAFDASADGFVRGEGVGLLLLCRLEDALANGHQILATIEATAVNQDGATGTITAPNPDAQTAMMERVKRLAQVERDDIAFAEAHGTGTAVGDPIEANAIGAVFGGNSRRAPLFIGSSKTNLGHLEPAAGVAGVIKSVLALVHGHLPCTLGYETPNPEIDFEKHQLQVASTPQDLSDETHGRCALVNSFGFGGTNACAILKRHDEPQHNARKAAAQVEQTRSNPVHVIPLSAPTDDHLRAYAGELGAWLQTSGDKASLQEIAATLAHGRDSYAVRAAIITRSKEDLAAKLYAIANGDDWPRAQKHDAPGLLRGNGSDRNSKVAFTMTGQGGQWWAMGRDLLTGHARFRRVFEEFDEKFKPIAGWSVIDALSASEDESQIDDAAITPAVMFAFQCGLAEIWKSVGITPDLVVGHSFGEVTAAYLAGAIDLDHVAGLVTERGLIRSAVDRHGNMAAIGLSAEALKPLLPADGSIEIGGYNAPNMVTVTGEEQSIDRLIAQLNQDDPNIVTRKLALDFAYHSSWFAPVEDVFKSNVGTLHWTPPDIPVVSTVTGELNTRFDADYWWSNLRYPVRYQDGINRALDLGARTFIELGPTRTLSSMTAGCAAARGIDVTTISTLHQRWDDFESIDTAVGTCFCAGGRIDWSGLIEPPSADLDLPHLPQLRKAYWQEPKAARRRLNTSATHPLLGQRHDGPEAVWSQLLSLETHPYLADHRIDNQVVFPAAGYIEIMHAAASQMIESDAIEIQNLKCLTALYIAAGEEIELQTVWNAATAQISIYARTVETGTGWTKHASAKVLHAARECQPPPNATAGQPLKDFYEKAAALGYDYGPAFQGLSSVVASADSASATLSDPLETDAEFTLSPSVLDSTLQLMISTQLARSLSPSELPNPRLLPAQIDSIHIVSSLDRAAHAIAHTRSGSQPDGRPTCIADFAVAGSDGQVLITITGLRAEASTQGARCRTSNEPARLAERLVPHAIAEAETSNLQCLIARDGRIETTSTPATAVLDALNAVQPAHPATQIEQRCNNYRSSRPNRKGKGRPDQHLIYLPPSPTTSAEDPSCETVQQTIADFVAFIRAINDNAIATTNPIWCVTRNARPEQNGDRQPNFAHAALLGAVRTAKMEHPKRDLRLLDIQTNRTNADGIKVGQLARVLQHETIETELVLTDEQVFAVRLDKARLLDTAPRTVSAARLPNSTQYKLTQDDAAGLNGLHWAVVPDKHTRDDSGTSSTVTVEVQQAGLNFRDIMAASGALPADAEPTPAIENLGLEFAGIVSAVHGTGEFAKGDRVFGMARGVLARRITVPTHRLFLVPDHLDLAQAATLASAYLTAYYALHEVGRVQPGERVLIHNASGAVGLAAINLCEHWRCPVFATAGTQQKRAYLEELGIDRVYDSRSPAFASAIREETAHDGVDIVLNALAGPFIDKGLECLAPYGRFIEIGKRDVFGDRHIGLRALRANQSFHVVDVASLLDDRPGHVHDMMSTLLRMIDSGDLPPLPYEQYKAAEAVTAFKSFSREDHIGKVVVQCASTDIPLTGAFSTGVAIDPAGTYLVTGGTRGMGRQIALWLRDNGAGRVIAASPNANKVQPEPGIEHVALDVTDAPAVDACLATLGAHGKPLRGIIHAAVRYSDALMPDLTDEAIASVCAPKITGAINLTQALRSHAVELDFFASFSSAAATTGWPGQVNYTAANAALEAIAGWQRSIGIPATCINWGVFGAVGHVAESDAMSSYLTNAGWRPLSPETICAELAAALDSGRTSTTVVNADWSTLAQIHPPIATAPRLSNLVVTETGGNKIRFATQAAGVDGKAIALRFVREQVARVLRQDPDALERFETVYDAGIDSLSAFELRNRLEQETGLEIPLGSFVSASKFDELSALLCDLARTANDATPVHDSPTRHAAE